MCMSRVAFSMGNIGGMLRMRLWQMGVPVVLLSPGMIPSWVGVPPPLNTAKIKAHTRNWVVANLLTVNQEVNGNNKQLEDMCDAAMYAMFASLIFCSYHFKVLPSLSAKQYGAIIKRVAMPTQFFIRNPEKEATWVALQQP